MTRDGPGERDDARLDAILQQPKAPIAPPPGAWASVRRRARRRKAAKAVVAVTAGVLVAAGAVPAVIAVRDSGGSDQTLALTAPTATGPAAGLRPAPATGPPTSAATPSPLPASALNGFRPRSVSFVSQSEGWLWGASRNGAPGIVAHTTDSGTTWSPLPAPSAAATDPLGDGESGIRFADSYDGFVFGAKLYVTHNAASSWTAWPVPGHIRDLETRAGKVWALVDDCPSTSPGCDSVRLYTATLGYPLLEPVASVPAMTGQTSSLALSGTAVDVLVGARDFWSSPDGATWTRGENPCAGSGDWDNVIGAWDGGGLVAVCGGEPSTGSQSKLAFESVDNGLRWSALRRSLPNPGYPETVTATDGNHLILGVSHAGGAYVTADAGRRWVTTSPQLGFIGYIGQHHVVALSDPDGLHPVFRSSVDGGRAWHTYRFPK